MANVLFLTPAQVVERWNGAVTVSTLKNWRSKGSGPDFIKFGHHIRYPLEKLIEYEAGCMRITTK